jgi:hypothetical protein
MLSHFVNCEAVASAGADALVYLPGSRDCIPHPAHPRTLGLGPGCTATIPADVFHHGGSSAAHRLQYTDPQPRYVGFVPSQTHPWDFQRNQGLPGNVLPAYVAPEDLTADPTMALSQQLWSAPPPAPSCGYRYSDGVMCGTQGPPLTGCWACAPGSAHIDVFCSMHAQEVCGACAAVTDPSRAPAPSGPVPLVTGPLPPVVPTAVQCYMPINDTTAYVLVRHAPPPRTDTDSSCCPMALITHENDIPAPTAADYLVCLRPEEILFVRGLASTCVAGVSRLDRTIQAEMVVWNQQLDAVVDVTVARQNGWYPARPRL